jgi:phytol kinase
MSPNLWALILSYIYVFGILILSEVLHRWPGLSLNLTRKFVHVGVGMWAFGTVLLFRDWRWAIVPPLTFIVINYISYRQDVFKAMEAKDKRNLGTVYFPISFAAIIALCWAKPAAVVAGLMPMVWGDALAAIVGQRWGRHKYHLFGYSKSWEGTATMLVASFASVLLTLLFFGLPAPTNLVVSLIVAAVATLVEGLSIWGIDNLTVPLLSTAVLWLLLR